MPCIKCGESAKDKCAGVVVGLSYDEDGTAHYYCLDCTIEAFKEKE